MNRKVCEEIGERRRTPNFPEPGCINRGKKRFPGGFTLLEILIAIFIFAVVATTIFGSFNYIFSATDAFNGGMAVHETARACLNRMTTDLQSVFVSLYPAYTPPGQDATPDPYRFSSEIGAVGNRSFPKLRFASLAHVAFEKSRPEGVAEIVYYVQPGHDEAFTLRRSDTLYPYQPFREKNIDPVLCENLKSLTFTYYDADGNDYDHWNSDSDDFEYATPRAVGIQLELEGGSFSQNFATLVILPTYRLKKE